MKVLLNKARNVVIVVLILAGGALFFQKTGPKDTLYQVSVLSGLMSGDYDGKVSLRQIRKRGDFGIGTFDRLDGEAVELDGEFYQVKNDGKIHRPPLGTTSPFAMTSFFHPDSGFSLSAQPDFDSLKGAIDGHLETKNIPYAVRVDGKFSFVKTRSIARQNKPYRPLPEIAKEQSVFEFQDVEGSLIGFRLPSYMAGVNLPGYHMHFLSRDKTKGGHLLECKLISGEVQIDDIKHFQLELKKSPEFYSRNLEAETDEVLAVEASK